MPEKPGQRKFIWTISSLDGGGGGGRFTTNLTLTLTPTPPDPTVRINTINVAMLSSSISDVVVVVDDDDVAKIDSLMAFSQNYDLRGQFASNT